MLSATWTDRRFQKGREKRRRNSHAGPIDFQEPVRTCSTLVLDVNIHQSFYQTSDGEKKVYWRRRELRWSSP